MKIIHKELSYTVRGVLIDVHNHLGPTLPEKFVQDAVMIGLEAEGVRCEAEKMFEVTYRGVRVGRYFVDIWIEDGKMLLELKVAPELLPIHRAQAISYLKVTGADLAVLANFGQEKLVDERLPNFLHEKGVEFSWQPDPSLMHLAHAELLDEVLEVLHFVHFQLRPGFFHRVYRSAAMIELRRRGIGYRFIYRIPVYYRGHHLGDQVTRLLCVEDALLIAAVAVQGLTEGMKKAFRVRLAQLGLEVGVLANFNATKLEFVVVRRKNSE